MERDLLFPKIGDTNPSDYQKFSLQIYFQTISILCYKRTKDKTKCPSLSEEISLLKKVIFTDIKAKTIRVDIIIK